LGGGGEEVQQHYLDQKFIHGCNLNKPNTAVVLHYSPRINVQLHIYAISHHTQKGQKIELVIDTLAAAVAHLGEISHKVELNS